MMGINITCGYSSIFLKRNKKIRDLISLPISNMEFMNRSKALKNRVTTQPSQ